MRGILCLVLICFSSPISLDKAEVEKLLGSSDDELCALGQLVTSTDVCKSEQTRKVHEQ